MGHGQEYLVDHCNQQRIRFAEYIEEEQSTTTVYSQGCNETSTEINLQNKQAKDRTGKFLKIEIDSFYGTGGGFHYLSVSGKNALKGN